jgi:rhodanese-related sulfurtransferase
VKRSNSGLYLEAKEVPAFIDQHGGSGKVLFVDIRTRAEAMYVGMPTPVDALVPYVEHQEIMTDWDARRGMYQLEPMQDFVPEMQRRLEAKGLAKTDAVVLICRSGDRSSRAANRLAEDGWTQVYSVVDGFEGDMSQDGRRDVNGWKNAGLPWSYKLAREKMYFPR